MNLDPEIRQAVVVSVPDEAAFTARMDLWERNQGAQWHLVNDHPVSVVIGRNGLAPFGQKREGDGRTPSGIYDLRRSFGYAAGAGTGLVYRQVTQQDFWIDDPASPRYNQWVTGVKPKGSHEILRREDGLYEYTLVVEYNTEPIVAGRGSAIFLHIWRGPDDPTSGCVAMAKEDLRGLLGWLKRNDKPVVILRSQ